MQATAYELKYCERCGSLRLRRNRSAETYCEPCGRMLANFSLSRHVERASRLLRKSRGKSAVALLPIDETRVSLPLAGLQ